MKVYNHLMRIKFANKKLEQLAEDTPVSWLPVNVIQGVRRQLVKLSAATDERDLVNFRSFCYESLKGKRKGQKSIRANKKWRIIFTLDAKSEPMIVTILSVEDYH